MGRNVNKVLIAEARARQGRNYQFECNALASRAGLRHKDVEDCIYIPRARLAVRGNGKGFI
jgi:hypothetical protein